MDLEKALDVAYQDVLNAFNSILGVKGLIMTHNNLEVTWKVRPQTNIVFSFPLRLHWFSRGDCVSDSFLTIEFSICAQKRLWHNAL